MKALATATTLPAEKSLSADRTMMTMLQEHVPLSLLCDLSLPEGPESAEILAEEGAPTTRWWEQ